MDNYLIDQEVLGSLVDELIKKKPLAVNSPEELNQYRKSTMESLDDKIGTAIFSQFTKPQGEEYQKLLDREDTTSQDFEKFFDNAGIDLEGTITNTMQKFAEDFMGGQND